MEQFESLPASGTDGFDDVAPLSVETDLTVTINGAEAGVESTGERLLVRFRSLPDAVRAVRGQSGEAASPIADLLTATDLTVEARVRDRIVAIAGADARPGTVSRSLNVHPIELRIGGLLGAAGAECAAALATLSRVLG